MLTERNSTVFAYIMDPSDEVDFRAGFALHENEGIADFTLLTDAASTALGLTILTDEKQPVLGDNDSEIVVWLAINESQRNDSAFDDGAMLGFTAQIVTSSALPRRYERSFALIVRQGAK